MNAFGELLDKLADIQDIIKEGQQTYSTTIEHLDNTIGDKKGLIGELETKIDELRQRNSSMIADLEFQRNSLDKREQDMVVREEDLLKRENALIKEIEDERKVSFVKATQAQLKDKIDELDIIQKQLAFYKKQCELLSNLTMKYCLNHEQLTIETIEEAIINRLGGGPVLATPQLPLVQETPLTNKKPAKPTKKQLLEEEKRKAEVERLRLEQEAQEAEAKKLLEAERLRLEQEAQEAEAKKLLEAERLRLEQEAQEAERHRLEQEAQEAELLRLEQEAQEAERLRLEQEAQEAEPQEEGEEVYVEDFTYKGVLYYLDKGTGEIYSRLENDEVGEVVGLVDSKGKVKITKKK